MMQTYFKIDFALCVFQCYNFYFKELTLRTKEQAREYNQRYYIKNTEKLKEDARVYYENNKEKAIASVHQYRSDNLEMIREKGKVYYRRKLENRMLNGARARAKKAGRDFNITIEDIVVPEFCPLLNIPLFIADGRTSVKSNSASLDRIDSTKGYIKGNVWVISMKANTMKSNSTLDEFILMADNWKFLKGDTL